MEKNTFKIMQVSAHFLKFIQIYANCYTIFYSTCYLDYIKHAMDVRLASIIWQGRKAQVLKIACMELK